MVSFTAETLPFGGCRFDEARRIEHMRMRVGRTYIVTHRSTLTVESLAKKVVNFTTISIIYFFFIDASEIYLVLFDLQLDRKLCKSAAE